MKDKTTGSVVTVKRAIKTLKGAADDVTKAMFIRECKLMVKLGKHRNICRMTGAAMQQVPWLRIIELVAVASGKAAAKAGYEGKTVDDGVDASDTSKFGKWATKQKYKHFEKYGTSRVFMCI